MAGTLKRLFTHLFTADARGLFPPAAMERIAAAIDIGETCHAGEVCFAVEASLPWRDILRGVQARARAEEAFARLRVWDTAANNGVLIYLLLADHRIEIIADRGLHDLVSPEQWRGICQLMEERMKAVEPEEAVMRGVGEIGKLLTVHFPQREGEIDHDELPNTPIILR